VDIESDGRMKKDLSTVKMAHVSPNARKDSSSFIKAHLSGIMCSVIHYHEGYLPRLKEEEAIHPLPFFHKVVFKFFRSWRGLNRAEYQLMLQFKQDNIQLIFAEYGPTGAALQSLAKKLKIPLIVHFHGFDAHHRATLGKYKKGYQPFLSDGSKVIAVSQLMQQQIISWGMREENILYSPCGCDPKFVQTPIPSERSGFIAVGNFVPKKGPLKTIQSFALARQMGCSASLTMVGDGPLLKECQEWVMEHQLQDSILFTGALSHGDTFEKLNKSLVFLQHSITPEDGNKEGTPVAILEAQGLGLAVVSTRHAGIPDVVIEDKTGILVEEGDTEGMAHAILALWQDQDFAKQLGKQGRERVQNNYTIAHHLAKINQLIESSLR